MRTERARSVAQHALKGALPVLYGKRPFMLYAYVDQ